ncbi:hypothetical protein [Tenacibaculum piscium]|uniref:hypothetical protein n=1 Tax=Tenacibaculum piscium TaxID=1458515 RepID=UPI001F4268AF|nr:hypothetical protein [Tenacibaculum piscium]
MNSIVEKELNIKSPELLTGSIKNSKFNKFTDSTLREFIKENFKLTISSQIQCQKEFNESIDSWEKNILILLCIEIENSKSFLEIMHHCILNAISLKDYYLSNK